MKEGDDSSSSEDEACKDALREATDHQFLKETFFTDKKVVNSVSKKIGEAKTAAQGVEATSPKSLRPNLDDNEKFENFGVTPSFQNYVAKKLDEIIERNIKLKTKEDSKNEKTDKVECTSGIRLLASSTELLTTVDEDAEWKPKRVKIEDKFNESENLSKCKEVAVEPKWVLSKVETKAWTSKRKEPQFKYKKQKNGVLMEQA